MQSKYTEAALGIAAITLIAIQLPLWAALMP